MEDKKVRLVIEFSVNAEKCKENNISQDEIISGLSINSSDVIDGYEIFPVTEHNSLDISTDFTLNNDAKIISIEVIK